MQFLKKLLCVTLSMALLLAVPGGVLALENEDVPEAEYITPLAAAQASAKIKNDLAPGIDVSEYPVLLLRGGWHPMYYMEGTEEEVKVFDTDELLSFDTLLPLLQDLAIACLRPLNWKGLSDIAIKFLWDAFEPTRVALDGSYDETISCVYTERQALNDRNQMQFSVDWRKDPVDTAYELRRFIEDSGYEKVNIASISGSGQVLLAYLALFGTDKLASVFFNMSMHAGSSLFGGFATKQFGLDPTALGYLLPRQNELGYGTDPLALLLRGVYEAGLLSVIQKTFKFAVDRVIDRVYEEAAIPLVFTMPHMWSYVPTEQYEGAKALLFKGDPKYDALVAKTDYYRYNILAKQDEILLKTASEVKTAVAAGYGLPVVGVTQGTAVQGDRFVDTSYASFGATCSPIDSAFPKSYRQAQLNAWDFMSPDRLIDASTCTLPETTWFYKYRTHRSEDSYMGWYEWFLAKEGDYTVFADEENFPQFKYFVDNDAVKRLDPNAEGHDYKPLAGALPQRSAIYETVVPPVLSVLLFVLKTWRFILVLPLFWM